MREDIQGMWWQDTVRERTRGKRTASAGPRVPMPVPEGYVLPREMPNLRGVKRMAIDVETRDEQLLELGPGPRRDGYIVGIAVGVDDADWYFPIRHEQGTNMDPDMVLRWCKDTFAQDCTKVGANILYDMDFLAADGVEVRGPVQDVQHAAALLDEHRRSYALGSLARDMLGETKDETFMYRWAAAAFGGPANRKNQAKNIWRCPPAVVDKYARSDVRLPLRLIDIQLEMIREEKLQRVWELECALVPMMLAMRQYGVRVDEDKAEELDRELTVKLEATEMLLSREWDWSGSADAPDDLARLCDKLHVKYKRNKKGLPLFPHDFLAGIGHPALDAVLELRKLQKMRGTFIRGYIFKHSINGRIHCEFAQLRADDRGTVSGRLASMNPNLQNIPARDPEWGPRIRQLFLPEQGMQWCKNDYDQIEPRLTMHYAKGALAESIRAQYRKNPGMDCYQPMLEAIAVLSRHAVKQIYLGATYGMGKETMADNMGMTVEEAEPHFEAFHAGAPYLRELFDAVSAVARQRGFVRTLLGRRARFPFWEAADFKTSRREGFAASKAEAIEKWGRVKRAGTHKGLNRVIQGGSADIMKLAMLAVWRAGYLPHVTVHDELGNSVAAGREGHGQGLEIARLMAGVVELSVPLRVVPEFGPSWGAVKKLSDC